MFRNINFQRYKLLLNSEIKYSYVILYFERQIKRIFCLIFHDVSRDMIFDLESRSWLRQGRISVHSIMLKQPGGGGLYKYDDMQSEAFSTECGL